MIYKPQFSIVVVVVGSNGRKRTWSISYVSEHLKTTMYCNANCTNYMLHTKTTTVIWFFGLLLTFFRDTVSFM